MKLFFFLKTFLTHREKDHINILTSDKLLTQTAETLHRTENDLTTTREELVKVQQCLKEKEYIIFELENKLNNRTNVTINESKMLTRDRDSFKNERDILRVELTQGKDSDNKLKMMLVGATLLLSILLAVGIKLKLQTDENIKLLTKERDSLNSRLDYEIMTYKNIQIELNGAMAQKMETKNRRKERDRLKNDLNITINENKLLTSERGILKDKLDKLTIERDSLKDKTRLDFTQGKDKDGYFDTIIECFYNIFITPLFNIIKFLYYIFIVPFLYLYLYLY